MKRRTVFGLLCIALAGSGCRIIHPVEMPAGHYYLNEQANFAGIGKVVLLELNNQSSHQPQGLTFTQTLADGLGKKHLFTLRVIEREDPVWPMLELDSIQSHTHRQLAEIREALGADAIVFGSIHRYTSYPYFLIAVHLKMVDLRDAKILWAIEEVWDSTDKATEQRMRQYFETRMRTGYQPMNWQVLSTSPRYFNKFVAYEITRTLPDFEVYQNPAVSSENNRHLSIIPENLVKLFKNQ